MERGLVTLYILRRQKRLLENLSALTSSRAWRSKTVHAEMNITRQKVGLSFSIENILRDDFCHSRRTNTNVESRETYFAAECWPTSPAYTCYAVPYGPIFMKYLPSLLIKRNRGA